MRRTLVLLAVAVLITAAEKAMGWATAAAVAMGLLAAVAVQALLVLRRDAAPALDAIPAAAPARRDAVARIARLWPLFAGWVVANVLLSADIGGTNFSPWATSRYSVSFVLVLLVLISLVTAGVSLHRRRGDARLPLRLRRLALPAVLLVLLAAKVAVVYGVAKVPGFDAGNVFLAAYGKGVPDQTVYPFNPEFFDSYFGILPNNLFLAWVFSWVFRIGALLGLKALFSFVMLAMVVNCLVLSAVELLTFLVVRRVWGARAAWISLAAVAVFTTLSPWLNTPYSDTVGMVFPILTVYLWLRLRGARGARSRLLVAAVIGIVTAAGIAVKPTTVFALVAIAIVELFRSRKVLLRRRAVLVATAALAASGVLAGGVAALATTASIDASGFTTFSVWTNKNALPLTHFLKMGAQGTGGYSGGDVGTTIDMPPDQRAGAALGVYFQRVGAMGIEGYPLFLERKAIWSFSDGSFAQGKEGDQFPVYPRSDGFSEKIREWFLIDGANHWYLSSLWQAVWLLLLIAAGLPVSRFADPRRRRLIDAGRLSMLLLLVFLLLFETRARYVYLYVPMMVALAAGATTALPAALAAARGGVAYRLDRLSWPRRPRRPRVSRKPSVLARSMSAPIAAVAPAREPQLVE